MASVPAKDTGREAASLLSRHEHAPGKGHTERGRPSMSQDVGPH